MASLLIFPLWLFATTVFPLSQTRGLGFTLTEPAQSNIFRLATVVSQMVTSKKTCTCSNPQTYECGLIEESEFADIIKDFEMWSYWIILAVPIFKVICFSKARQKEIYHRKKTEKEERATGRQGRGWSYSATSQRMPRVTRNWEAREDSCLKPLEGMQSYHHHGSKLLASDMWKNTFHCFKPSGLWQQPHQPHTVTRSSVFLSLPFGYLWNHPFTSSSCHQFNSDHHYFPQIFLIDQKRSYQVVVKPTF